MRLDAARVGAPHVSITSVSTLNKSLEDTLRVSLAEVAASSRSVTNGAEGRTRGQRPSPKCPPCVLVIPLLLDQA